MSQSEQTLQEKAQIALEHKSMGDLRYNELLEKLSARTGLPIAQVDLNIHLLSMGAQL